MKRFLFKLWGFPTLRNFIKFFLWAATLLILLHVEEDWRGARTWAATKANWEAKGISFDPAHYIPAPVPDAENVATLPMFQMEPNPADNTSQIAAAFIPTTLADLKNHYPPEPQMSFQWLKGEQPDFAKLRRDIASYAAKILGSPPASNDPLAQLEAIYPFIPKLNAAAATRPYFRLNVDNTTLPPGERPLGLITSQIRFARVLSMHAILALDEKKSGIALTDLRTLLKMSEGIGHEPSLVSGLVASGLSSISATVISHGLIVHAWNDAQLAEIQSMLARLDLLANGQRVLHGECIVYSLPMMEFLKQRLTLSRIYSHANKTNTSFLNSDFFASFFWSDGWVDQSLSMTANELLGATALLDPKTHRVFVDSAEKSENQFREHWTDYLPWNMLSATATGPIVNTTRQFSRVQTWLDEAGIACGLERYRLAHGEYPQSLDALVPACIGSLPCDLIDGKPYCYRVKPDETYLLYSIGWNQKDDGGTMVLSLDHPSDPTDSPTKHGDWVWPTAHISNSP